MAVNLRKKYYNKESVSKKNKLSRFRLDYSHESKPVSKIIKDVEFLLTDPKEIKN
jgi:hypothetical protein